MSVRSPAAAGTFYPSRAEELRAEMARCLPAGERAAALAAIVPHAGYRYSGRVAGEVFARIEIPRDVVILAFHHRGRGADVAVSSSHEWLTPLGRSPVNEGLARRIVETCPGASFDDEGHREEHSAEVQLPFLQFLRSDVRIVPVALSLGLEEERRLADFGRALAGVLDDELVIGSTDLNHYENHERTLEKDRKVIDPMERLDGTELARAIEAHRVSMCGFAPAIATLAFARAKGATKAETVAHRTSGDASGDFQRCVGYVGMIIRR